MKQTGVLGEYRWWEISGEDTSLVAMIRALGAQLVGLAGVNVSWDSGLLELTPTLIAAGWTTVGGFAVSPVINVPAAENWPTSECQGGRFDEWYFFRQIPLVLNLRAFCNYGGVSLQNARDLSFPGGVNLEEQLQTYAPEVVIGQGEHLFAITRSEALGRILDSNAVPPRDRTASGQ